jgi:hypothetical protein
MASERSMIDPFYDVQLHPPMENVLDRQVVRRAPTWLLPWIVAGMIAAIMPELHYGVFGVDAITNATITQFEAEQGARVGAQGRELLSNAARNRPVVMLAVAHLLFSLAATMAAGAVLSLGLVIFDADLSTSQALMVAAASNCGVAITRVLGWGAVALWLPHSVAVAPDWVHVATLDASLLLDKATPAFLRTLLSSIDLFHTLGIAFSVIGIREVNPRIGIVVAIAASAVWLGVGTLVLVGFSALTGIPVV